MSVLPAGADTGQVKIEFLGLLAPNNALITLPAISEEGKAQCWKEENSLP